MAPRDPELIDVRPEERLDARALAAYLGGRLEGAEGVPDVEQFGGGHANLTYLLAFGEGPERREFVLRRPPLGPVAPGSHDMEREYRALSVLWKGFPKAPRAYLFCEDETVIGSPFVVMERRHGLVVRGRIPDAYGGGHDPEKNRRLSEVVIDVLAELHRVDPKPLGLDALGHEPEKFLERQVEGWAGRYERAATKPLEAVDELVRWLREERPASPTPTLLHNDWRLDNMALDPEDPGRCTAVYDWDMCTVGDPLCDLGTLLATWSDPGQPPAGTNPMPTQSEGFLTRDEAVQRYGGQSRLDVAVVPYYDVFGTFKMAVVLQQIFFRFHRGQTRDKRFAGLEDAAEGLFRLAASRRP